MEKLGTSQSFTLMLFALGAASALGQATGVREMAMARIPKARAIAADPEILKAVAAKNAMRETLEEIRRKDGDWAANPQTPLRKQLSGNACAQRLRDLTKDDPAIVEVILMDWQGANVCVSRETSDYWQGDEAKFRKTYGADKEVLVDEPAFDASSGTYAIQLSVMVMDRSAKLGALTLTLRVRKHEVKGSGQ
jgi:hypothetical protein